MPANERETVGLNLTGDFASKAQTDAAAALQAAAALERLGGAAASVKGTPKSAAEGVDDLATRLKAAKHAADELRAQADKAFALGNKRRGEALEKSAEKLDPIFSEEKAGKSIATGGFALMTGAHLAADAAEAIARAGVEFVKAGVEFGIRQSSQRAEQTRILDRLTNGEGDLAYRVTMSLAGEKGVDPAEAAKRVKGLVQAGFDKEETEILFRASADLGAVKGDEKGKTFLELLEKTAAKGKVNEESLNGLAEAGVEAASVLGVLAKKGEALDAVRARVKAGQVTLTEFTKAVGGAVSEKLGGVAGHGLDASINRIKITASSLFDDFDLSPLERGLDSVQSILASPTGTALKSGIKDVGDSLFAFLDPLKTEKGKQDLKLFFDDVAAAAHKAADVIRTVEGGIGKLFDAAVWLSKAYKEIQATSKLAEGVSENGIIDLNKVRQKQDEERYGKDDEEARAAARRAGAEARAKAAEDMRAAGLDSARGYAAGLDAGKPVVDAAMRRLIEEGAIEPANDTLDRHSPSRVFAGMGKDSDLGYAKGVEDHAHVAADATEAMAEDSIGAARRKRMALSPEAPTGGGGASGPGLWIENINIAVAAASGMTEAGARAIGEAAAEGFEARVRATAREMRRDDVEFGVRVA